MKFNAWGVAGILSVAILVLIQWRSSSMLETLIEQAGEVEVSEVNNNVTIAEQPVCAEVPTDCGFPLVFYRKKGETAAEFAKRIKVFVAEFEKNWN